MIYESVNNSTGGSAATIQAGYVLTSYAEIEPDIDRMLMLGERRRISRAFFIALNLYYDGLRKQVVKNQIALIKTFGVDRRRYPSGFG